MEEGPTMRTEHCVYSVAPGSNKKKFVGRFTAEEWQDAEKLAGRLEDKGHRAEVVTVYVEDEGADDD